MLGRLVVPTTLEIKGRILAQIVWWYPLDPHPNSPLNCPSAFNRLINPLDQDGDFLFHVKLLKERAYPTMTMDEEQTFLLFVKVSNKILDMPPMQRFKPNKPPHAKALATLLPDLRAYHW